MDMGSTSFSRRTFIGSGAAALAGLALMRSSTFAVEPATAPGADVYDGLPFGVQSYTFRDRSFREGTGCDPERPEARACRNFPDHLAGMAPAKVKELLTAADMTATGLGRRSLSAKMPTKTAKFSSLPRNSAFRTSPATPIPIPSTISTSSPKNTRSPPTFTITAPAIAGARSTRSTTPSRTTASMIGLCNDTGHFIRAGEDPIAGMRRFPWPHARHAPQGFQKERKRQLGRLRLGEGGLKLQEIINLLLEFKFPVTSHLNTKAKSLWKSV